MVPSLQLSRGTLMTMLFTFLRVLVLQEYDNYYWKLNFIGYLVPKMCKYDTWWYKLCVTGYLVPKCAYINLQLNISSHWLLGPKN